MEAVNNVEIVKQYFTDVGGESRMDHRDHHCVLCVSLAVVVVRESENFVMIAIRVISINFQTCLNKGFCNSYFYSF